MAKKIRGIYKRGNTFWIGYAGLDGKVVYESSGSTRYDEAEELWIKRKKAIKDGKQPEIRRVSNHATFRELVIKYSEWMQGRHRSADNKLYRIRQLAAQFGNLPLRSFNTLIVEQYQTELISRGLMPSSVNKNISLLKAMIKKAVDWEAVSDDVLKRVRAVKQLTENNRRLRYLSQVECTELLSKCEPHLKPIVVMALNTGMRKGEILSLTWEQVDLRHGFILLDITKNGERREIPLNDTLKRYLNGITRRLDVPYVFFDPLTGKRYKNVKNSFNTAVRRAKIHDFRFHDLRHTFASHLVMAGVDITTVKELLGHKTLTMTLRYAHLAPSHKVKAVDLLDSKINAEAQENSERTIQKVYNRQKMKDTEPCLIAISH